MASHAPVRNYGASVHVTSLLHARKAELRVLREATQAIRANRRVYQQLAWHLRRRTMSHSSRRAPARVRAALMRELSLQKKGNDPNWQEGKPGPKGARRLRKYRRKARFLVALRKLRNAKPERLETHTWHAKRFHMMRFLDAAVVPSYPNDRGVRSAYRAMSHACVAHDASYLCVVQVTAQSAQSLRATLVACLLGEDAVRVVTDPVMAGVRRVQNVVIVDSQGMPVAPVDLLWRSNKQAPQVWMWVHPVAAQDVVQALESGAVTGDVKVESLRNKLCTFSIIGPRSGYILGVTMNCSVVGPNWDAVRFSRSPASLPAGCVLTGEVEDPRAAFPPKRTRAMSSADRQSMQKVNESLGNSFMSASDSDLWDAIKRTACKCKPMEQGRKQSNGRQGSRSKAQMVPFILLQREAGLSRGFGSGWDLVIPSGWGMAFWTSIMYANGARAVGQRDMLQMQLECSSPVFPYDFLDTERGKAILREEESAAWEKYKRRPKSKRVNYDLYRVKSPFFPELELVVRSIADNRVEAPSTKRRRRFPVVELESGKDNWRIVRSKLELRAMLGVQNVRAVDKLRHGGHRREGDGSNPSTEPDDTGTPFSSEGDIKNFARMTVRPVGRGVPERNGLICMPTTEDLIEFQRRSSKGIPEQPLRGGSGDCTREVIGRVTLGGYSFARGEALGSAVVSLDAIRSLLSTKHAVPGFRNKKRYSARRYDSVQVRVLFRNIDSLHYRPAVATLHL